jgi:uncharacterized protein YxeA
MTCKLHINLNQGLIEFEGNEEFVLSVYNDFKDKIGGTNYLVKEKTQQSKLVDKSSNSSGSTKKRTGYTLCKDLNLYKEGDKPSLQDFMQDYNANTNPQRYLLFAHYLKNIKNVETV